MANASSFATNRSPFLDILRPYSGGENLFTARYDPHSSMAVLTRPTSKVCVPWDGCKLTFLWTLIRTPRPVSLTTNRLGVTPEEPHTLEVREMLPVPSPLLWHLTGLRGLRVIAKKSWALTDDFEAYFTYKGRLFIMETPFAKVNAVLLGSTPDEALFSEVEAQVQSFPWYLLVLTPIALLRFFVLPFNPSLKTLERFGAQPAVRRD